MRLNNFNLDFIPGIKLLDYLCDQIHLSRVASERFKEIIYQRLAQIKIVDSDLDLALTADDWQKIRENLDSFRNMNWCSFIELASNMKILDPTISIEISDQEWQEIIKALKSEGMQIEKALNEPF